MTIPKRRVYRFQIIVAALCIGLSGLVVMVGAMSTQALTEQKEYQGQPRQNTRPQQSSQSKPETDQKPEAGKTRDNNNDHNNNNTSSQTQVAKTTTVTNGAPQATTEPPAPAKQVVKQQPQVQETTTIVPVVSSEPTVDTSAQVAQVASAQAGQVIHPSEYPTTKISTNERNDLYKISLVSAVVGLTLYLLSYLPALWRSLAHTPAFASKIVTE